MKVTKFGILNFKGTFVSRDLNVAKFLKSQKSREFNLAKISDSKVLRSSKGPEAREYLRICTCAFT